MKLFCLLVGMVMVFEGIPYVAAPEKMKAWLIKMAEMESSGLRVLGLISMILGIAICYLVQTYL